MSQKRINKFARWKRSAPRRPQNNKRRPRPSAPSANLVPSNARLFISISGQSNALGTDGTVALTTSQPYDGLRQPGRPGLNDATAVALVEAFVSPNFYESPASAMGNMIHELDGSGRQVIVHNWAVGSTPYSALAQGTSNYIFGQTGASNARTWVTANRPSEAFFAAALAWKHGENDEVDGVSAATYAGFMATLKANWEADMRTLTGAVNRVPLFMMQHSASSELNPPITTVETSIGMWLAANNNTDIFLVGPDYWATWIANNPHINSTSERRVGRYFGRVIKDVLLDGHGWKALQPQAISAVNNVVTIDFEGGDGSALVFDTTNVVARGFYGFDYSDSQADIPSISSVAITGTRQVQLTLSRNAQAPARVTYANYCALTVDPGAGQQLSAAGNLRDQDPTPSNDGDNPLWNWCAQFDRAIDQVTGSASSAESFANSQSFDSTGAARALLSARALSTLNGASAFTISWCFRSNAASWPTAANAHFAKAASGFRCLDARTASGASGRLRVFHATSNSDASNWTDYDGHVGQTWYQAYLTLSGGVLRYRRGRPGTDTSLSTISGTLNGTVPSTLTSNNSEFEILNSIDSAPANFNICHFAIWTRALTTGDEDEAYNSGTVRDPRLLSTGGPAHYWPGQGTYADLGSATSRNLIPFGAISFEAIAP